MWHLHWRADAPRRSRIVEPARSGRPERPERADGDARAGRARGTPTRASFQHVWHDTPAASLAADVPESVRVRGR